MHHIYQMLMTDELFWRWSYILYLRLCLYLCVYDSELYNSKCHFLWIMDVSEFLHKRQQYKYLYLCYCAFCCSRRHSKMFSSLMERRVSYLRITESWNLAKLCLRVPPQRNICLTVTGAWLDPCFWRSQKTYEG
jgi:hypothetical protein